MYLNKNKKLTIKIIAIILALTPPVIIVYKMIETEKDSIVIFENTSSIISIPILVFYLIFYVCICSLGIYWVIKKIKKLIILNIEKEKTELMFLKSQVNPHFFFNMLNNLYGLVGKDSKKAQELILKLSEMMRYSIYEGEKELVPIREEVDYLKNYIELHKMRYHKKIAVNFHHQIEGNCKVIPLLFIILLENAFKHGVERLSDGAFVNISMIFSKGSLHFMIENNFNTLETIEASGIGLKNLKRRLELAYSNSHKLSFSTVDNIYKAQLTLNKL